MSEQSPASKPHIIHLVDDLALGGVRLALEDLCHSSLAEHYRFSIKRVDFTRPWLLFINLEQADLYCIHTSASWRKLPGLMLFRLMYFKLPILFQEHHYSEGFVFHQVRNPARFYLLLKLTYRFMDRVLAVSKHQASWMLDNKLLGKKKLLIPGQARDLRSFACFKAKREIAKSASITLGAYGRLHAQKGFDILLQAFALLSDVDVKLKIAGDGEQLSELRSLAAGIKNIELLGAINNVPEFISQCDLIVIPSRWEPFGLTCLEARVMEKPIICSEVDGLQDQVTSDNHVYMIKELTPEAIAEQVRDLIANPPKITTADGQMLANNSWQQVIIAWKQLLNTSLKK